MKDRIIKETNTSVTDIRIWRSFRIVLKEDFNRFLSK